MTDFFSTGLRFLVSYMDAVASWLGSSPMFAIFCLTCFLFICRGIRSLIGR